MSTNNRFHISSPMLKYLSLIMSIRLIFDIAYRYIISTLFSYMGFNNGATITTQIFSWILLIVFSTFLFKAYLNINNVVSHEIIFLLFIISFLPFTSLLGFNAFPLPFSLSFIVYWFILISLLLYVKTNYGKNMITFSYKGNKAVGDSELIVILLIFFVVVALISGIYTNFRITFDLLDVYDNRAEARSVELPTIITYIYSWSRALNSIIIVYFLRKKKYIWVIICGLTQVLSFGFDGSKTTLFLLLIAIIVGKMPSFSITRLNNWFLIGILLLSIISVLSNFLFNNIVLSSLFIRRVFYLPLEISNNYFDFFSNHQPDFFRQSFLRYFGFKSPYPPISRMIGKLYYNSDFMSANNGLLSDAIANLGYVGILVFPILITIVLKTLDGCSFALDRRILFTVSIYVSFVFVNSFLFTVLLTHGLLLLMVLLSFMDRHLS